MSVEHSFGVKQLPLRAFDRLTVALIGVAVIFASLGLGEAVYRVLFFDFDGATDRLPIEMAFGVAFAGITMKLVKKLYKSRMDTSARVSLISERNLKIRAAVEFITPIRHPGQQQAIRVIREEAERIERAVTEILPRQ